MTPDESRPQPQNWPAHRVLAALLLCLVIAGGAAIVFLPIGWQLNRFVVWLYYTLMGYLGIEWISIEAYDFLLNMLLFAVPAFLAAIVWPRVRVVWWIIFWCLMSLGVEVLQYVFLPRDASLVDLTANTLGGAIGAVVSRSFSLFWGPERVSSGWPEL